MEQPKFEPKLLDEVNESWPWVKETREMIDSLLVRLSVKQKELESKEKEIEDERQRLRKLSEELLEEHATKLRDLELMKKEITLSYEEKLKKLEDEKILMKEIANFQKNKVKLDIGGHVFSTSVNTLCKYKNSMLSAMFSGRYNLKESDDGTFFIDRDGTYFRYILNFLRGQFLERNDLPSDRHILREIKQEADFYQLDDLVQLIDEILINGPLGENDFSQEDINKLLSTVVKTEKVTKNSASNPSLLSQGISVANAALKGQRQNSTDNNSSYGRAMFVVQNLTKNKLDFTGKSMSGISFSHTTFNHDVSFRNTNLSGAIFYGCEFNVNCTIDFTHSDLRDCDFRNCKGKEAGPKMSFGPSTFEFGSGGLVSGASSDLFIKLIQTKKIVFRGAKIDGAKFDPNVFNAVTNSSL